MVGWKYLYFLVVYYFVLLAINLNPHIAAYIRAGKSHIPAPPHGADPVGLYTVIVIVIRMHTVLL